MKRIIYLIFLACALSAPPLQASTGRLSLKSLFERAEQCYLTDDYEQLETCINRYAELYMQLRYTLGDSADVYAAYYYKMVGGFYYGETESEGAASRSAESYYRESLRIFEARHSDRNVITLREELAQLFYKVKRYDEALEQLDTIFEYYDVHLNDLMIESYEPDYYRTLSQLAICRARLGDFSQALDDIRASQRYFKRKKSEFYYETLRREGKILMMQADSQGAGSFGEARACYERYVNEEFSSIAHRLDTMSTSHRAQHWLATHRFLYDCYRLGNHAPELLYNLALFSKGYLLAYESDPSSTEVRWQQVRRQLGANDCAIEFVQYFGRRDERRIGCLVLHRYGNPKFIDLFASDSLLSLRLSPSITVGDALDSSSSSVKDTLYNDTRVQQLVWPSRLMEAIGSARRIFFAPDGLLHQLAIEYLMPDDTYDCYRLSSTRNLLRRPQAPNLQTALLCGGITFRAPYTPQTDNNDSAAYRYLKPLIGNIIELPNSRAEVDSIYATRQRQHDLLLMGGEATDYKFLSLLKNNHYDIVHVSTHGHYVGRIDIHNDLRPLAEDLSLSRCGLIFAGASNTLSDNTYDDRMSDAILSGSELSQLDLSQSELVVCNACQTGQGRLTDDGIYGLQRALKQAGAHTMLVSLWSINDYSSGLFLRFFYEELDKQDKTNIHAAFLAARQRLIDYEHVTLVFDPSTFTFQPVAYRFNTPKHVNPFILIDAF